MRKSFSIIILALIAAVSLYAAAGCKNDSPPEVAAASIVLSADTLQLNEYVAPQATLTATVLDAEGNVLAGKTVTWRSDNESVATVSGGVVTYVGAGNAAITAASGEIIKACAVTATSASPYLQVGEDSIGLKSGATAKLEVSAKYNGEAFTAGIIEFAVANPAIATVSGGAVTGVSEGTTTVTVTLKLGDVVLDSAEIEVTVTYDVELTLEADITTIYTYALPALNAAFVNTATLESGLIIEGTPSQNALTFRSSNASVATVSNGIVTALAAGTARIKAEYVHQGVTFSSPEILFTVEKAAVTKEEKVRVFVEDSIIAGSAFFMNDGYAVIGAYDFDADIERSRNYYDGGLDTDALTNDLHGERTWIIECEEYLVICPVLVVTNRISTTDDLKNVFNDSDGTKSIVFNGYYLLMNNIDASAYAHYNQQYGSAADSRGLTDGTFDGDGYTISGITLNNGGLFGRVIRSTVKNLALADVKLIGSNNYTSIFGNYGTQSSTVENVFISMSWGAATGYVSVFGRYFSGNTVKSLVVVINDMPADISKYMILSNEGNNTNSFSKTYIVSRFEKLLGANTTIGGISKFDTVAEMAAAGLSYGLSGTYWNSAAQVIPVFKTSLAYINASAFDFGAYGTFNLESNEKLNINLSIAGVSLPTANEYVGINGTEISIGNYLNFDEDLTVTVRLTYAFNAASYKDITLKISAIAASTLEVTAPVIIDLYGIPDNYILNNASLNAADGYRIYLVNPAGVKAVLAGTLTAGEVAITKASLLAAGEGLGAGYTLRIVTAALDLRYTAVTVRQEIDTAAKLKSFSDASYTAAVESRTLVGLYILTANIDASSVVTMTNWVNAEAGFGGILDGQGYAVDKFKPNAYGLFGTTNKCTVRNIAFTNVSRTGDYIFGAVLKGATVTNVMIEVASCGSKTVGLLAKYIQASGSKSSVFTNFVMILPSSYAGYIMTDDWNNGTTYTNFKLVTTSTLFAKSGNTTIPASVNAYASAEALAAANVTSAFTAAVWSQVYKLPVFVTAVPYIEGTVNAAATVASGDTLFTGNYYRYTVSGTGAALISIVNGAL
ncbi:MAG: Ig-like domain-containing protein, partial [Clostridiales bacterium]|nr:Ig-like domain-containing protein [Clostridiales bacterium]